MCNSRGVESSKEAEIGGGDSVCLMDSPSDSVLSPNDENPRVKFLCSFSGSILPRPQDGKLRYVGGETRIVSVSRDIGYEELMGKMRELFEGATVLKYQQPDEDLDALVSVVNDDDVTNMMEEYDKLGSSDGFSRLRIFLFSNTDQDGSLHFGDGDERDHERRYVDALNSLNDSPEFRKLPGESLVMGSSDDTHVGEQYFNQLNLEGSLHGQRNMELPMAQMNLRRLTIPRMGSQQPVTQRYSEMETPWSPAYFSPRQPANIDQRQVPEISTSPSSCRYHMPHGDFSDRGSDRMPEDYIRPAVNTHLVYEQQPHYADNVVLIPTGPAVNEKAGFPGNLMQGPSAYEGNSICEHCRTTFPRNQVYPDSARRPAEHQHLESPNMGNGYIQVPTPCAECPPNREMYMLNSESNMHPSYYCRDQNDPRSIYPEAHSHEREWLSPHQSSHWVEESRPPVSVPGRLAESYIMENGMCMPLGHANVCDAHHPQSPYTHHQDLRYARPGVEYGSPMFQDPATATASHIYGPSVEERGARYANSPFAYGPDNMHQVPHAHIPSQTLWRNVRSPMHGSPSCETSVPPHLVNGSMNTGFVRGAFDGSPRVRAVLENHNPWSESSHRNLGFDGSLAPENSHTQAVKMTPNTYVLEGNHPHTLETVQTTAQLTQFGTSEDPSQKFVPVSFANDKLINVDASGNRNDNANNRPVGVNANGVLEGRLENGGADPGESGVCDVINQSTEALAPQPIFNIVPPAIENGSAVKVDDTNASTLKKLSIDQLEFLPELIASVKEAHLHVLKEVNAKAQEHTDLGSEHNVMAKENAQNDTDRVDVNVEVELDSDDNSNNSKIEPTKAEAEAIDRGLQTIRNEDLEEIRELGSGTYGAVFHGKWKGSDVAIKRIKASCFAGKPSERERLIADFWKEAQILSSLHHPNVVSFYGVVRDGPDGSLATVTEFMINGSLKQFLQKKDRTIDRRKRLIIAMDAAFGMEYLHAKNIVHFDLKCENLLVNMRDPHRPVCKIGDLGLSKVRQQTLVSGGVRGTLPWMAPELLSGKSNMVTEKIDVYSFGIVMWEVLTGDEPYADMHCASLIGGIVNNTLRPQIPPWCDPEWKALMESCWDCDPTKRPSFSEISQRLRNMAAAMNLK